MNLAVINEDDDQEREHITLKCVAKEVDQACIYPNTSWLMAAAYISLGLASFALLVILIYFKKEAIKNAFHSITNYTLPGRRRFCCFGFRNTEATAEYMPLEENKAWREGLNSFLTPDPKNIVLSYRR